MTRQTASRAMGSNNFLADTLKQFLIECGFTSVSVEHKYWDNARIGLAASKGDWPRCIAAYARDEQEDAAAYADS